MRKILVLSLAVIILLGITSGGTFSYFSSSKDSVDNTFTAWVCPAGSVIIVSDTSTEVTEAYTNYPGGTHTTTYTTPLAAVAAWEHTDWGPVTTTFAGLEGTPKAGWIWETQYTNEPGGWGDWPGGWPSSAATGRVVQFEREFEIDCSPMEATLRITVDNGYTVWINGNLVGCSQVNSCGASPCADPCIGWENYTLIEAYVNSHGWETVKTYNIPESDLVVGTNTLVILAANEEMSGGTAGNNPAGLIYWLKAEWGH
jgi:predicted ribosomally synthesized peptide with SipW-like signal peptide